MNKALKMSILSILLTTLTTNAKAIEIKDVTDQWTYGYYAVSAFNRIINTLPTGEDHEELFVIYHYTVIENGKEKTRRIEGFTSSGDCGTSYYLTTDAEQIKYDENGNILGHYSPTSPYRYHSDDPRAYFIEKFSSWDSRECGDRQYQGRYVTDGWDGPRFKLKDLKKFIETKFINKNGMINKVFVPICDGDYHSRNERKCITTESLGDLGA